MSYLEYNVKNFCRTIMSICTRENADLCFIFSAADLAAANAAEESSLLTVNCSIASTKTHCSSFDCFNQTSNSFDTKYLRRRLYFNLRNIQY